MVHEMALEIGNTTNERGHQGMSFDDEFLLSPNGKEAISKSPEKFKLLKVSILQSLK